MSAPALPVSASFPDPDPPSIVKPFVLPLAEDKSIVTAASAFAVNVALPALVELLLVPLVAVKPAKLSAVTVAPEAITKTSLSEPPLPPRSTMSSVPLSTVIISLPEPPVIISSPAPPVIVSTSAPPIIVST